ncbi:glycosyltransferase [Pseudanabaena sp. lw0831]|uniref:glycosyltransferase family 4 protein n=1 Tax=Pseudanabaena sp. lw0831 TaxID=1357935 RepID=UPI00191645D0|nr:glycosyltransferase family 4 protein [Pseudanabaena sp. lw0831]GBO52851.1 glycosyltransferase [Pseudanabaena sp. lw0831]
MKICIITSNVKKGDGQARVNYEIVNQAIARNHQITLVVRHVATEIAQNKLVSCVYFAVEKIPTELMRGFKFTRNSDRWLQKNEHEYDLIISCGAVTSRATDINVVHFVHSAWLNSPFHTLRMNRNLYGVYQWMYTALNAYWEKFAFQKTKMLIAVSETIKNELIGIGIDEAKIQVIANGVDVDEFFPTSPAYQNRQRFGLPEKVDLALFVGEFRTNRKNLDTVLKALVNVPSLHLAVVGSIEKSSYPQLAKQMGLAERVHFLGYRSDIAKIMQAVDFFVFPSRYEPFGMVVSEAMASGLPVITTAVSGVAAIITPECGIVLPDSEDVLALTNALITLTTNFDLRMQMGKAARAIAEQHSWISKAKTYLDLFERFANPKV